MSNWLNKHKILLDNFHKQQNNTQEKYNLFTQIIYNYYQANRRSFVWREEITPYAIVVSEIMLQQTQTERVAQKFPSFLSAFPNFASLSAAGFPDILKYWKGLGYNRRALALQKIAHRVTYEYNNKLPDDPKILEQFPGIGKATAGSIIAFAYNKPTLFIETNVRTVLIYFFFREHNNIHDKLLRPILENTLDKNNPREFYYALMDYGVWLKKTVGNLSQQSAHYAKQSRFEGSDRQIRGRILQALLDNQELSQKEIINIINQEKKRVEKIIINLSTEGYIKYYNNKIMLVS